MAPLPLPQGRRAAPRPEEVRAFLEAGLKGLEETEAYMSGISRIFSSDGGGLPVAWSAPEVDVIQQIAPDLVVLGLIGRGGMGAVYCCHDPKLKRAVAVKLLPPELAREPDFVQRFEREGQLMAQLHHRNIVSVQQFLRGADDTHLLVMEYVETDLDKLLKAGRSPASPASLSAASAVAADSAAATTADAAKVTETVFAPEPETAAEPAPDAITSTASAAPGAGLSAAPSALPHASIRSAKSLPLVTGLRIFCQVCDAIHHAHQKGVVHRDLKPSNILVDAEFSPRVADFGLARPIDREAIALTRQDARLGTGAYMAPELETGAPPAPAMDIYALGVILYEIVAGQRPGASKDLPRKLRSGAGRKLNDIIKKALEPDPADRWKSAEDLGAAVAKVLRVILLPRRVRVLRKAAIPAAALIALAGAAVHFGRLSRPSAPDQTPDQRPDQKDIPGTRINSLGQKFVPVPGMSGLFACVWETRCRDFAAFVSASGYTPIQKVKPERETGKNLTWADPGFAQTENDPVVCITWDDANAFCQWLTETERKSGALAPGQCYRLLSDREWNAVAAVPPDKEAWIWERASTPVVYPWGGREDERFAWENIRDTAPAGYPYSPNDVWTATAPAGSLRRSTAGFYDLGANVREWILDPLSFAARTRTARGSAFRANARLWSLSRRSESENQDASESLGFRVALDLNTERALLVTQGEQAILTFHGGKLPPPGQRALVFVTGEGIHLDLTRCAAGPLDAFENLPVSQLLLGPAMNGSSLEPLQKAPLRHLFIEEGWPSKKDLTVFPLEYLALIQGPVSIRDNTPRSLDGIRTGSLRGLHIAGYPGFTDLAPLSGCTELKSAVFRHTGVKDVSPLAQSELALIDTTSSPAEFDDLLKLSNVEQIIWHPFLIARFWDLAHEGRVDEALAWLNGCQKSAEARGKGFVRMTEIQGFQEAQELFSTPPVRQIAAWAAGGRQGNPPDGLWEYQGSRYHFIRYRAPYPKAEWLATVLHGHIAAITTKEELDYLAPLINEKENDLIPKTYACAHIGARRSSLNTWHWITGEPWGSYEWGAAGSSEQDTAAVWGGYWNLTSEKNSQHDSGVLIEWSPPELTKIASDAAKSFTRILSAPDGPQAELLPGGRVRGKSIAESWWVIKDPHLKAAELYERGGALRWTLTVSGKDDENLSSSCEWTSFLDR